MGLTARTHNIRQTSAAIVLQVLCARTPPLDCFLSLFAVEEVRGLISSSFGRFNALHQDDQSVYGRPILFNAINAQNA